MRTEKCGMLRISFINIALQMPYFSVFSFQFSVFFCTFARLKGCSIN